jgi:hypothetical protein
MQTWFPDQVGNDNTTCGIQRLGLFGDLRPSLKFKEGYQKCPLGRRPRGTPQGLSEM